MPEKEKHMILAVDDEPDMLSTYKNILKKDHAVLTADSGKDALGILKNNPVSLVILDIRMPKMDGIEVLKKIKTDHPEIVVIMATASKDVASAVEAMKLGAFDYINKPFDVKEFQVTVAKALENAALIEENLKLKETIKSAQTDDALIGACPKIKRVKEIIAAIALTDSTVLITGESGSGKEIAARLIHKKSKRSGMPFIALNCAAIPENLLESELFGHERGSFTGAVERRIGKFELADGGTLFLDEIGCMSPAMQSKLLRVLEDKKIERLGSNAQLSIDVRIIAATNIDFEKTIKENKFREDLYYRLNVIPVAMPPLRERLEDLPLFISFFINKFNKEFNKKIKTVSQGVMIKLKSYSFPGNVRELQNLLERATALALGDVIEEEHMFGLINAGTVTENTGEKQTLKAASVAFEKNLVLNTLSSCGWNKTQAARQLSIARSTLCHMVRRLKLKEKAAS